MKRLQNLFKVIQRQIQNLKSGLFDTRTQVPKQFIDNHKNNSNHTNTITNIVQHAMSSVYFLTYIIPFNSCNSVPGPCIIFLLQMRKQRFVMLIYTTQPIRQHTWKPGLKLRSTLHRALCSTNAKMLLYLKDSVCSPPVDVGEEGVVGKLNVESLIKTPKALTNSRHLPT